MHVNINYVDPEPGEESGAPPDRRKPVQSDERNGVAPPVRQDEPQTDATLVTASAAQIGVRPEADAEATEEVIDGAALLNEIFDTLDDFVKLEKSQREAVALWIMASRCAKFTLVSPVLYFSAPGTACGKTKALSIVAALVHNPVKASSITAAAVYRAIEARAAGKTPPTLVLDNAHLYLPEDSRMVAILSGGFDKGFANSIISGYQDGVPEGIEEFSTWCAKVLAGNEMLPAGLRDCSIVIRIKPKRRDETILQVAYESPKRFADLRRKTDRWLQENEWRIRAVLRKLSNGRDNRVGDKWAAMLAIARVAGGNWYERAKHAMSLIERSDDGTLCTHELVLREVQRYFRLRGGSYALSRDIVAWMTSEPESIWSSYGKNSRPFNAYNLGRNMERFHVHPCNVELKSRWRGYKLADLQDLFERYPLPDCEFAKSGQPEEGDKAS